MEDAAEVRRLLACNSEELSSFIKALNGEYVQPAAGGDLLRDGPGVLPTGARSPAAFRSNSQASLSRACRTLERRCTDSLE